MTDTDDIYVIRQSESGDYFLVPIDKASDFVDDELEGNADYAIYIDLFDLQITDFEV